MKKCLLITLLLIAHKSNSSDFLATLELYLRQAGASIEEFATQMRPLPPLVEHESEISELLAGVQELENNRRKREREQLCAALCIPPALVNYFKSILSNE